MEPMVVRALLDILVTFMPLTKTRVVKSTIVIEDTQNAECRSETSTVAAESILRRKKLKTAASRLSVRDDGFPSLNRL